VTRKLILSEYVSLDGVVQAPGHQDEDPEGGFAHGGWTSSLMHEHSRYNSEAFQTVGAFLLGRRTYEIFAAYWPTVRDENDEIARALNRLPKYVASRTLADPAWEGTTVVRDVPREVAELKERPGKPIFVLGSADLAQTLIEHQLVDEYHLWLHPVVIGDGKRLFRETAPRLDLRLIDARVSHNGLVILTYGSAADRRKAAGKSEQAAQ
jgi:dihydrofolate reductase